MSRKETVYLLIWAFAALFFSLEIIDAALLFSMVFLTPLLLKTVVCGRGTEKEFSLIIIEKCIKFHWFFALIGGLSIVYSASTWAAIASFVWLLFTIFLSISGFLRLIERGCRNWEEVLINIGLIYLAVGGGWLVLSRLNAENFLPYSPVIIDLTAIHFHYAAFCLLIVSGLFGRWIRAQGLSGSKRFVYLAGGLIAGPIMVAVGLDAGPPLEPVMVSIYVLFLAWLSAEWILAAFRMKGWQKAGIIAASSILPITMTLSIFYSVGLVMETPYIVINDMIKWHGAINAFVFSFIATVTWKSFHLTEHNPPLKFPISQIRGKGVQTRQERWFLSKAPKGLFSNWNDYERPDFDPEKLTSSVRAFYTQTDQYTMKSFLKWHGVFKWLTRCTRPITRKIGQLNLPHSSAFSMNGSIKYVIEEDGRRDVRAWLRDHGENNQPIFTALYSSHVTGLVPYMNIALPLPYGTMTAILRPEHGEEGGLILTSHRSSNPEGEEGVYMTFGSVTFRTPFTEYFCVKGEGDLTAVHEMKFFGLKLLSIEYVLNKK